MIYEFLHHIMGISKRGRGRGFFSSMQFSVFKVESLPVTARLVGKNLLTM